MYRKNSEYIKRSLSFSSPGKPGSPHACRGVHRNAFQSRGAQQEEKVGGPGSLASSWIGDLLNPAWMPKNSTTGGLVPVCVCGGCNHLVDCLALRCGNQEDSQTQAFALPNLRRKSRAPGPKRNPDYRSHRGHGVMS